MYTIETWLKNRWGVGGISRRFNLIGALRLSEKRDGTRLYELNLPFALNLTLTSICFVPCGHAETKPPQTLIQNRLVRQRPASHATKGRATQAAMSRDHADL